MSQIENFLNGKSGDPAANQGEIDKFLDGGKPPSRTLAAFANDTVIEVANAAAGGVSAAANFFSPGNAVSGWIDKNIVQAGEASQSDVVKAEKERFRKNVADADGTVGELGAVGGYVLDNPVLSAAQAVGSFVGPGVAVKGGRALASFAGLNAARGGLAGGAAAGAAMAGGDAAGTAYELSIKGGATDEQAVDAGRQASVIPAVIGGLGGVVGAERLVAGAKGFTGTAVSRALKTAAVEGAQEGVEEGVTQYEGQRAAMPYDKTIDPMKGVAAAAGMGAALGAATGGGAAGYHGFKSSAAQSQPSADQSGAVPADGDAQPGAVPSSPDMERIQQALAAQLAALQQQEQGDPNVPQTAPPDGAAALAQQQAQAAAQRQATMDASRAVESPDDEIYQSTGATVPRSVAMGLDPKNGSLSAAAALAVDSGAHQGMQPTEQPQAMPRAISLEEADAQDAAAYSQFFDSADAHPVVARYFQDDADIPNFEATSNVSTEDFLRSLGATEEDIQDAIATSRRTTSTQSRAPSNAGAQADVAPGAQSGAGEISQGPAQASPVTNQAVPAPSVGAALASTDPLTQGTTNGAQADQTQQTGAQPAQSGAAKASAEPAESSAKRVAAPRGSSAGVVSGGPQLGGIGAKAEPAATPQGSATAGGTGRVSVPKAAAIARVNAGKATFFSQPRAHEFVAKHGLGDTHEVVQQNRAFHVKAKAAAPQAPQVEVAARALAQQIDSPSVGALNNAVQRKNQAFARLKLVREQVKNGQANRLDLLKADSAHRDELREVAAAKAMVEAEKAKTGASTRNRAKPQGNTEDGATVLYNTSDSAPPERGLSLEQTQQAVQKALAGLSNPPPIDIVGRSEEAWVGAPEGVMGAAIPKEGRIVLVASAHRSADAVVETLFHEMFHLGVHKVLPTPDYVQSMLDLAKRDSRVQKYAIAWKADAPDAPHQLRVMRERGYTGSELTARYEALAIEEGLAVVAEEMRAQKQAGTRFGLRLRMLASWMASVADRMGMPRLANRIRQMTYNEAERFVLKAIEYAGAKPLAVTRSETKDGPSKTTDESMFSRSSSTTETLQDVETENAPEIWQRGGVQFPKQAALSQGRHKILTEKQLAGYRRANSPAFQLDSAAPDMEQIQDLVGSGAQSKASDARMAATQKVVDVITAQWGGQKPAEIVVARNMQDGQIPPEVRAHDALLMSHGATGEPRGFIYQGKVYLLSDQLQSTREIAETLFHEVLGHHGLRGAFGTRLDSILRQIGTMRRADVLAKARSYGLADAAQLNALGKDVESASDAQVWAAMSAQQRLVAAEEVLAEMAETQPKLHFVQRAVAAVRTFLRELGLNLRLTDAEIVRNYLMPAREFVTRKGGALERGGLSNAGIVMPGFQRGTNEGVTNPKDVVGNQGGRSADDTTPSVRAARQILDAIEQDDDSADYALRVIPGEFEGDVNVGDILPASKQWADGNETSERLNGTSAVRIRNIDEKSILEALRNLGALGKNGPNGYYFGNRVALVKGESLGSGEDVGELIIDSAEVVGIWKKPSKGLSEIQPNESTAPDGGGADLSSGKSQTDTAAFKNWFGDSLVTESGEPGGAPKVVYHGTADDFSVFSHQEAGKNVATPASQTGFFFTNRPDIAQRYSEMRDGTQQVFPVYLALKNPTRASFSNMMEADRFLEKGFDGDGAIIEIVTPHGGRSTVYAVKDAAQIKSAIGNNGNFDPKNPDILFSRKQLESLKASAVDQISKTFTHEGKVSLWDKTVGTMRHLAERSPAFKPVFESAQRFIDDVSTMANDAANMAPRLIPRVENLSDVKKRAVSVDDNKAVSKPLFEGTLLWARDMDGKPMLVSDLQGKYANLPAEKKAQILLASGRLDDGVLKMWKGLPLEQYENLVNSRFEGKVLKAGIVWEAKELRQLFGLNDQQVSLYQEARATIDRSIDMTARADMLRAMGPAYASMRDAVLEQPDLQHAMELVTRTLQDEAKDSPESADRLLAVSNGVVDRYEKATELMAAGYAPLSRFGPYTLDVVGPSGERLYFGMYESMREANIAKIQMASTFPGASVTSGTMSAESYKLFAGVTPESLEMFGNMLGLDANGGDAQDKAFQEYIQLAKNNHSALKRLIHRKGIAGYSEDVGRVLASFVYSNARLAAGGLNAGTMEQAISNIPKEQGELRDVAIGLQSYIRDPQEGGQAIRGMMFAQYLGGSLASAAVNMTQPFAVTMPWLSQFGGMKKAATQMARALKDMGTKGMVYEADLASALKHAEDEGVVSPQEIHQLMAQARGAGSLRAGDGTRIGNARAAAANNWERVKVVWGQPFALAEQFNRRSTFIAAFRTAQEQGMANPADFARKAVLETQFLYSKANKAAWARGTVGGTLFTFKNYSVSYLELMQRMWTQGGPEGKRAVGWAMLMLMLMSGAGGLPFLEDLEDVIDGAGQMMGYNMSMKHWRKQALRDVLGKELAGFIDQGITGLPGSPIDVSGRMGMGNLIPGTGLLLAKPDHSRDLKELVGPAGDLLERGFTGARKLLTGDVGGAALDVSPAAVRNAVKGVGMATSGMYKDAKGYKVVSTTLDEAIAKAIGFQPKAVQEVQESNGFMLRSRNFYQQTSSEIKAQWADALFRKDESALNDVRERLTAWNRQNPDQQIVVKMPDVWKKVREMGKDRTARIADTAPKAMRQQLREMARE